MLVRKSILPTDAKPDVNGHRSSDLVVLASRLNDVSTTERRSPENHLVISENRKCASVFDTTAPVFTLLVDIEDLPVLAVTATKVTVVEDNARVTQGNESFGEGTDTHLLDTVGTVAHDDHRAWLGSRRSGGREQPAAALFVVVTRDKLDIFAGEPYLTRGRWYGT